MERQPSVYTSGVGNPTIVHFNQQVQALYLRITVLNGRNNPSSITAFEVLPIVCNSVIALSVIGCGQANLLNSGTNPSGTGKKAVRTFDNNWKVALHASETNLTYTEASQLAYVPAIISGNAVPQAWVNSPFGNAEWISYAPTAYDVNTNGVGDGQSPNYHYYKYKFNINDPYLASAFKLKIDFYVDNFVEEIYVNGIAQCSRFNLLGGGFNTNSRVQTNLDRDWQFGENELLVKTIPRPPYNGFLIQNVTNCVGVDFGDTPNTYGVLRANNGQEILLKQ